MFLNKQFYIAIVIVIIYCLKNGSPIFCYDCNSLYDPRCGEQFDSFSLGVVNCSLRDPLEHLPDLEPTLCRTIKMDIFGKSRVVRQCGYVRDPEADNTCQHRSEFQEIHVTYCSCDTDLCNNAEKVTSLTFLPAMIILMFWIM